MTIFIHKVIIGAAICMLMVSSAVGQTIGKSKNGLGTPIADALRAHGVETSQPSLIAALQNSDPEVRSLAAFKLTGDHVVEAIPAIETALSSETNLQIRLGIAQGLADYGDAVGVKHLD